MSNWWDDPAFGDQGRLKSKSQSMSVDEANMDPVSHALAVIGEGALHAPSDLAGFVGDVAKSVWDMAKDPMHGINLANIPIPGTGEVAKKIMQSYGRAQDRFTKGQTPKPRNKAEEYANVVSRGIADTVLGGGPEEAIPGIIAGAAGAVAGQGTYDLTGNENLSNIAGLLAGVFGGAAPHVIGTVRAGSRIARGMSRPEFEDLFPVIISNEGGGSLAQPNVSKKGARGPMQVMGDTATDPGFGIRKWDGKTEADRARVGTQYLAMLTDRYDGDYTKIMAAYNSGPGRVDKLIKKHGDDWAVHLPDETKKYIDKGMTKLTMNTRAKGVPPMDPSEIASIMDDPQAAAANDVTNTTEETSAMSRSNLPEETPNNVVQFPVSDERWNAMAKSYDDLRTLEGTIWDYRKQDWVERDADGGIQEALEDTLNRTSLTPEEKAAVLRGESIEKDPLTPAERQEMDASVPTQPVDNTGYEKFTPYPEDKTPANDDGPPASGGNGRKGGDGGGGGEEPPHGPDMDPSYEGLDPEEKLIRAIQKARPTANEQRELIHTARQSQAAVLEGLQRRNAPFHEQLGHLAGDLPGADYEPIRHNFTPEDVSALEYKVNSSNILRPFEKVNALKTLHKLLSDQGVKIPTRLELKNLSEVFSQDLIKAIIDKNSNWGETVKDVLNVPRTVMSSGDISAPARQGLFFVTRKEFWTNYPKMIKMLGSERAYQEAMREIKERPTYGAMKDAGVYFGDRNFMSDREEAFMSNLAEKIPAIGHIVRASDRAYTGYLNRLRADVFDSLYYQGQDLGISWKHNHQKMRALGNYINTASGRGSLGQFEQAATAANTIFFSPRLIASRVNLLNPLYYAKLYRADPFLANQAMRDLLGLTLVASTMLSLAKLSGASVEIDPRSTDFAKAKIGNTRIDMLGGFQPYMRLLTQIIKGEKKNSRGEIVDISQPGYGQDTRFDVMAQFVKNKFAPLPAYLSNWASQTKNNKFDPVNEAAKLLIPMYSPDVWSAYQEHGTTGLWAAVPSILGFGVQTYETPEPKEQPMRQDWWNDNAFAEASKEEDWTKDPAFNP